MNRKSLNLEHRSQRSPVFYLVCILWTFGLRPSAFVFQFFVPRPTEQVVTFSVFSLPETRNPKPQTRIQISKVPASHSAVAHAQPVGNPDRFCEKTRFLCKKKGLRGSFPDNEKQIVNCKLLKGKKFIIHNS